MRLSTVKKSAAALAALLLLAMLLTAALPWLASTRIVRDRIAHELSLWSGYRVSLGGAPVLSVWPGFKATLNDVAFHEWTARDNPPVLEADRLEVSMSAFAALRGNVVMSSVSMYRPLLRLTTPGSVVDLPASPGGGRMVRAVDAASGIVRNSPTNPDQSALPSDTFGTVEFVDGRIAIVDGNEADIVTSLTGKIAWPSLDRPANLTATAIWRGENITVDLSSAQPLMLLAGGNAPVKASLKSTLLEATFDGTANLSGDAFFDGQANLSSPSLRRMLEWSKTEITPGAAIGATSISSRIQGTADRLRLDSVALTLGGNSGSGVLDISFADPVPAISGTLAFDKLDLRDFLSAFAPIASGNGDIHQKIDTGFSDQLSLDLRLSATTAALGTVALNEVAASSQIKGGLAVFDVSDATAFGGNLQASIRVDAATEGKAVEMRVMASDVDAFALAKAAGSQRMLPQGRATISVILKGNGSDWNSVMGSAQGSVTATLGPGALVGLDLQSFRNRWADGGFFPLSDVAEGTLPLRGVDFKASVDSGVARIEKADLILDGQVATLKGIIPYFGRALLLSGHFEGLGANGARGEPGSHFFIGGAWNSPFVTPAVPAAEFE